MEEVVLTKEGVFHFYRLGGWGCFNLLFVDERVFLSALRDFVGARSLGIEKSGSRSLEQPGRAGDVNGFVYNEKQ